MNKKVCISILFFSFLMINSVYATPSIQIISPENTTYSQSKILINMTSNEPVDFYLKHNSKNVTIASNTTSLESYLYVREGSYNFTIYASNSNGTVSETVIFTEASEEPPINVTTCGVLGSPDTEYILINNVSSEQLCFYMEDQNISFNLNGKNVNSYSSVAIYTNCKNSKIFNGSITNEEGKAFRMIDSSKCIFRDLETNTQSFAEIWGATGVLFERINANVLNWAFTCGFPSCNIIIKNSTFVGSEGEVFLYEVENYFSKIIIENSFIENFIYSIETESYYSDYYIRNTYINPSTILTGYGFKRVFIQHLIKINVTEDGEGIAASVDIVDTSDLPKISPDEVEYVLVSNPTSNFSVATNEQGLAETWLTEKIIIHASFSPLEEFEYKTPIYNLTAKSKNTSSTQVLNITGNSTFKVKLNVSIPKLPPCELDEMFDLNEDEIVDISDAIIMLRRITGLDVQIVGKKNCEARNFLAVS